MLRFTRAQMNKYIAVALGRSSAEALLLVLALGFGFLSTEHVTKDHWSEILFYSVVGLFIPVRSFIILRGYQISRIKQRPTV